MSTSREIKYGALAGFIGAIIFGLMMLQMMPGVLPKIAQLYGFSASGTGFLIHLVHGALIGGLYGIIPGTTTTRAASTFYGLMYGAAWWVIGPILVMPTWLGAGPRLSAEGIQAALPSLPGHLVYGIILGLLFIVFSDRQSSRRHGEAKDTQGA